MLHSNFLSTHNNSFSTNDKAIVKNTSTKELPHPCLSASPKARGIFYLCMAVLYLVFAFSGIVYGQAGAVVAFALFAAYSALVGAWYLHLNAHRKKYFAAQV
ncbi:MAG: hypothetical protein ACK5JF_01365 [Oscillospiraceae bacterium]